MLVIDATSYIIIFTKFLARMRILHAFLVFALALPCITSGAQEAPLEREVGREMARQIIALVEKEGLPPHSQSEYETFKAAVLDLLNEDGETINREQRYLRLQLMLNTLDNDSHTFLSSARQTSTNIASTPGVRTVDRPEPAKRRQCLAADGFAHTDI